MFSRIIVLGDLLGEEHRDHYMKLERQMSSGLESNLLDQMASPDYMNHFNKSDHGIELPESFVTNTTTDNDGYLAPDITLVTATDNNGYLVPNIEK